MTLRQRAHNVSPGKDVQLIQHSDAGSRYTSVRLIERLSLEHAAGSIGSVGDADDNAWVESANGFHKTEYIRTTNLHAGPYKTIADVGFATAAWVDSYTNSRLHSSIGVVPHNHVRHLYDAALNPEEQPTMEVAQTLG